MIDCRAQSPCFHCPEERLDPWRTMLDLLFKQGQFAHGSGELRETRSMNIELRNKLEIRIIERSKQSQFGPAQQACQRLVAGGEWLEKEFKQTQFPRFWPENAGAG